MGGGALWGGVVWGSHRDGQCNAAVLEVHHGHRHGGDVGQLLGQRLRLGGQRPRQGCQWGRGRSALGGEGGLPHREGVLHPPQAPPTLSRTHLRRAAR